MAVAREEAVAAVEEDSRWEGVPVRVAVAVEAEEASGEGADAVPLPRLRFDTGVVATTGAVPASTAARCFPAALAIAAASASASLSVMRAMPASTLRVAHFQYAS